MLLFAAGLSFHSLYRILFHKANLRYNKVGLKGTRLRQAEHRRRALGEECELLQAKAPHDPVGQDDKVKPHNDTSQNAQILDDESVCPMKLSVNKSSFWNTTWVPSTPSLLLYLLRLIFHFVFYFLCLAFGKKKSMYHQSPHTKP
jgi:hypothetical protein